MSDQPNSHPSYQNDDETCEILPLPANIESAGELIAVSDHQSLPNDATPSSQDSEDSPSKKPELIFFGSDTELMSPAKPVVLQSVQNQAQEIIQTIDQGNIPNQVLQPQLDKQKEQNEQEYQEVIPAVQKQKQQVLLPVIESESPSSHDAALQEKEQSLQDHLKQAQDISTQNTQTILPTTTPLIKDTRREVQNPEPADATAAYNRETEALVTRKQTFQEDEYRRDEETDERRQTILLSEIGHNNEQEQESSETFRSIEPFEMSKLRRRTKTSGEEDFSEGRQGGCNCTCPIF